MSKKKNWRSESSFKSVLTTTALSGENVMDSVCQALKDLSEKCFGFLLKCFLVEDLIDMKKLHLEKVINFFLKFADGKITKDKVSECEVVKEIMDDIANIEETKNGKQRFQTVHKLFEQEATSKSDSAHIT